MFVLIGLCGGTVEAREIVAAALVEKAGRGLGAWVHAASHSSGGGRISRGWHYALSRANALAAVLEGLPAMKADAPEAGLVISHVLTNEEAEMVRAAGGHIWHLANPVSAVVAIRPRTDLLVTGVEGGERHFLDPLEALSEQLVRNAQAAPGPRP